MGWNDDHYRKDDDGNFYNQEEVERANDNGDLTQLSNGNYYDTQTHEEYYFDGEKKN